MAWMFVVNGASLRVTELDDVYAFRDKLEAHETYREIQRKAFAIDSGFVVQVAPNPDDQMVDVFVGKEILPDRHMSQGKTTVCPLWNTDQIRKVAAPLADELTELMMKISGTSVEEGWGIVVNVFD